ncbi:MAG: peptide ABC transporter substrate-binding protein [Lysobacterales bacterium]|nr:MAG: peptide ABC transporter substrate-binding protein [Xanthomonadales bacterium]
MLLSTARARLAVAGLLLTLLAAPQCTAWASATLNRGLGPEPDSLHIHQAQGLAAINLLRDIREGLVTFDAHGEPIPGQAASWEVLDEGRRYRFTLRPDARWSNGDPVTANDFVRAWRRAFAAETTAATAGLLKDVLHAQDILEGRKGPDALGIRADGPGVLEIELSQAAPWILEVLAHPVAFPLHEQGIDDARNAPVNGPFMLAAWTPRASLQLRRNPQHYAAATIALDGVDYFPIEEPAAELARYRAGELHVTETIPAGRFAWLQENLADDLRVHPYLGSFWLGLNLRHPVLGRSRELRQALSLAINRDILVRTVLGAGDLPGWSVVPPGMSGYRPSAMAQSVLQQAQRETEARRLFRASGAGQREPLRLELRYNTSGVHRRIAVAVAAMWKQVLGVNTELVNEEWKVFVNNRTMGVVTEVFRGGWIADYADPGSFLDLFISGSSLNSTFYGNSGFDELMAKAAAAGGAERMDLLQRAEAQLIQDMPVIPLYYYVSRHLVSPAVRGFENNVRDIHLSRYLELETSEP